MQRSFIREILEHTTGKSISFAGGLPDSSLFPHLALQTSAKNILENAEVLQYAKSTGVESLKEKIATFYTEEDFVTCTDEILITSGSQQALDIITRYYHDKSISIESPSYLGAINVFKLNRLEIESIILEQDGVSLDDFEKSVIQTELAYLIPDFQNPSGVQYSQEKREIIAQIIRDSGAIMIEDAPYSKLYFNAPLASISSMIPNQSFHLGSFSKTLAPALRIGWIRADKALLQPLIAYKEAMDLHSNGLVQHILNDYLEDITQYEKHLELLRQSYHDKMLFFAQKLEEILPDFIFTHPKGGMFIYGLFKKIDSAKLLQKCLGKEVLFVPGSEFYTFEKTTGEIRFNFTNASKEEVVKGLRVILEVKEELS